MPGDESRRRRLMARVGSKPFGAFGALLCVLVVATPAIAAVSIENFMSASSESQASGLQVYEYGSGTDHVSDFAAGTHSSTVNNSGVLELGGTGGPADWWDLSWTRRQCFDVKSSDPVTEYPLRFEVDTTGTASTGADIRVVEGTNGTLLTSYSEGPFTSSTSVVWAKAQPLPSGVSTYCVYFSNPGATTVSDEEATFDTVQTTNYYTMLNTYPNSTFQVISYTNGNVVSDGTTTVTLNAGQIHVFNGVDKDTVITATGPIEGSRDSNGTETLLPESYAHNEFIHPVTRGSNGAWVRSPHGNTTIQAIVNGVVVNSLAITPASGSVWIAGDFASNDTLTLRSTNGLDFLAMWKPTANNDVGPAVPWYGDPLYGVRSRWIFIGAIGNATVQAEGSDGTSVALAVSDLATANLANAADGRGNGTAFELTSSGPNISAYQYADQNGSEITALLPTRLLSETFLLPINANYYTIACPTNPTTLTIGGNTYNCASGNANGPGFYYPGLGFYPAGTKIEADNPIYVYYESDANSDEHNLLGLRGSRPYLADISYGPKPVEVLSGYCGTWLSPVFPATGVFGTFANQASFPAGTSATFQISTDGSAFYGPDGLATSSFANGDIVPYVADFASTIQIRIELCTTDPLATPSVSLASVECDLVELVPDVGIVDEMVVASPAAGTDQPLLRVYQNAPGNWNSWVEYSSGVNIAATDATFDTDHPSTQVTVIGGTPSSPSPPFTHSTAVPYTLSAQHQTLAGQTGEIELTIVGEQQLRTEFGINFVFNG